MVISNLLSIKLPIENKRIALRNILDFLTFIDNKINIKGDTLLPISSKELEKYFSRNLYKEYMKILKDFTKEYNINIIILDPNIYLNDNSMELDYFDRIIKMEKKLNFSIINETK